MSWRRLAPITATERGLKNRSIEAASARCSRLRHHADRGVGRVDRELEAHHAVLVLARRPGSRRRGRSGSSAWLSGSTSATNRSTPRSRPAWARCSSSSWAIPRPWCSSSTRNATSASPGSDHVVAADRDHLGRTAVSTKRDPVDVVDLGEPGDVAVGQRRHRAEEPVVLRLVGHPGVELDQQRRRPRAGSGGCARSARRAAGRRPPSGAGRRRTVLGCRSAATSPPKSIVMPALRRGPRASRGPAAPGRMAAMARRTTTAAPPRRLRGAHPRHRRRRRDARVLPRVRLLRHLLPRPARRPRRPQAGAAPDPLHDGRDGPAPRPRPRQERPRRRRGHGPAAPARRRRDLRRPGPDGAAVVDAAADDRRARQLRLARRPPRRDALHRVPDGARRRWR